MAKCHRCLRNKATKFNGDEYCQTCTSPTIRWRVIGKNFEIGVSDLDRARRIRRRKDPDARIVGPLNMPHKIREDW